MLNQQTQTLTTIFSEVLANLAFMFTDEGEILPNPEDQWLETVIGYNGPTTGTLKLYCPRDFSNTLASNLLGLDPEDHIEDQHAFDATKEFMNVVCGQFVTAAYGREDVYDLTIPEINTLPQAPDFSQKEDPETAILSVDGKPIQIIHVLQHEI